MHPEIRERPILLERGWSAERTLNDALVEGMRIVGIDFRDGILFVPEVLLAANAMKGGMEVLRPLLSESDAQRMGKVVIGTVKGDIHDIGKNLVAMMLEGAGFEVIDLGINNPVENYLAALDELLEVMATEPRAATELAVCRRQSPQRNCTSGILESNAAARSKRCSASIKRPCVSN